MVQVEFFGGPVDGETRELNEPAPMMITRQVHEGDARVVSYVYKLDPASVEAAESLGTIPMRYTFTEDARVGIPA